MRNGCQEEEKSNESRGETGTHGTKPKSHSSGNIPGHQGLNGQPVCVFTETTSEKESKTFTSYEGTKVVEG